MKNNFSPKTRELFDMGGYCEDWEDSRNDADCLHHCLGRISSSPLNACPLNNFRNHQPEGRRDLPPLHSDEVRSKYLQKTLDYLTDIGYELTEEDIKFMEDNSKYYEKS